MEARSEAFEISHVRGLYALDSRGNPTVRVIVRTRGGGKGSAIAPSGASKGSREAVELRDGGRRWKGMGVSKALALIEEEIAPRLRGVDSRLQEEVDRLLILADGTRDKSRLGANSLVATSIAVSKAAADTAGIPLYRYLGGVSANVMPVPLLNVINGGLHAGNRLDFQEFMIIPVGADSFIEAMRMASEVYQELKGILKKEYGPASVNVGDEGGFAPPMDRVEEALGMLEKAVKGAGYSLGGDFLLGIDVAASQLYDPQTGSYRVEDRMLGSGELVDLYSELVDRYDLAYIEDPFEENDLEGFAALTAKVRGRALVSGDDLYVTNPAYLEEGIKRRATTAAIAKVNQVGTLTEAVEFIARALQNGVRVVVSHRSGDSEDPFIADLAVAMRTGLIKSGAPSRGERTAKYNRLIEVEEELGATVSYPGKKALLPPG
ncbi:MAG: phosphopyruvate hydratase [Desulfurococcales archaeon]|nr:phosphopyruvate hydratase [Desulfurococcales archaeon]